MVEARASAEWAVDVGEPRVDVGDAVRIGRRLGLGQERRALLVGRQHHVEHASSSLAGASCATPPIRAFLLTSMSPPSTRDLALDQVEQRRLAACRSCRRSPVLAPVGSTTEAPSNRRRPWMR